MSPRRKQELPEGGYNVLVKQKKLDAHFSTYAEASDYQQQQLVNPAVDSVQIKAGKRTEEENV